MVGGSGATLPRVTTTDSGVDVLLDAARAAQANSYSPYSKFAVGAAIRTAAGNVYAGCNVEIASYPEGLCAEAAAIAAMVNAGEHEIVEILTVCPGDQLSTCCGGCRQRIREFARSDTLIYAAGDTGVMATFRMDEFLPASFGPENLR